MYKENQCLRGGKEHFPRLYWTKWTAKEQHQLLGFIQRSTSAAKCVHITKALRYNSGGFCFIHRSFHRLNPKNPPTGHICPPRYISWNSGWAKVALAGLSGICWRLGGRLSEAAVNIEQQHTKPVAVSPIIHDQGGSSCSQQPHF